ncbi:DNA breaking-rejoining enzyme [Suillus bovinus]|uniref:DNA breaking-rejoining enzyme n=1 Tax=Suillus bovinus TaxID=48563 RepID=UPI001B87166D|nr:DNA breaking-rejoining enzyme [Suillus bovinus]KAG2140217.1 DNA breaking-rejoining enzyme [Suillus bovinus]
MSSTPPFQTSACAGVAEDLALLRESLARQPVVGEPPTSVRKLLKPRKPKKNNILACSTLRPHVLACDRVRVWSAPHSTSFHSSVLSHLPFDDVLKLLDVMLISIKVKTRENYGAGLLRFHQYCDSRRIPEQLRMPAPDHLLASFIASWAGKVASSTVHNWLAGIHFWHNLHGAPWHGRVLLRTATSGLAKVRPRRPPVTLEHMHALVCLLDLSNTFDVAVLAVASTAFWSCCRLGELLIDSANSFDPTHHTPRNAPLRHGRASMGVPYIILTIPWTKTTHGEGANLIASGVEDPSNPVSAIMHHLSANASVPDSAPFFAFKTDQGSWAPMTRTWFVNRCNKIWKIAGLPGLSGHCFRIGGATELLLRGTPPDVVAMQGRWKSRAFLEYWRKIDSILPVFITSSFSDSRIAMINSSMNAFSCRYQ